MDLTKTTQQIKDYFGASYTVAEVQGFIEELQIKIDKQAPYFNGRDLDKLEYYKKALDPEP